MNKKKTTTIITILVVLLLAVAVIPDARNAVESFLFKKALNSALPSFSVADSTSGDYVSCGAGTQGLVSSLNRISFMGNDAKVGGDAFLVEFRDLPDSQCLKGTIDDSQISADGHTATKDLTISLQSTPQTCNYQIIPRVNSVFNIQTFIVRDIEANCGSNFGQTNYKLNCDDAQTLAESQCPFSDLNPYAFWYDQAGYNRHLACFILNGNYQTGSVNYDHVSWNTKVTATIGGVPYSDSIGYGLSSSGVQTGQRNFYLGSNNEVFVEFGGNLLNMGDVSCPNPATEEVQAVKVNGLWQTKDDNYYDSYRISYDNGFNDCFLKTRVDYGSDNVPKSAVEACVNILNNAAYNAVNVNKKLYSTGFGQTTYSSVFGNIVKLEQSEQISYPSLVMRVKASTLGVQIDSGQPEIVSATIPDFQSSFSGNIIVQVRNIGVGNGAFTASAVCDSPIAVKGSSTQTVSPSASATLYIPLTGSSSSDVNFNCRVTVTDAQSRLSDSKTVSGKMKGGSGGCYPIGGTSCSEDGNSVLVCQADGNSVVQQSCTGGCVMTVTGAVCTSAEICGNGFDDDSDGLIDDRDPDCQKKKFPWALTILGITVAGLIGMLFYVNLKKKRKKRGRR